ARLPLQEHAPVRLPADDLLADLLHALRAERVGLAREPELREGAILALEERRRSPFGMHLAVRHPAIHGLESVPGEVRRALQSGADEHRRAEKTVGAPRQGDRARRRFNGREDGPWGRYCGLLRLPCHSLAHARSSMNPTNGSKLRTAVTCVRSEESDPIGLKSVTSRRSVDQDTTSRISASVVCSSISATV